MYKLVKPQIRERAHGLTINALQKTHFYNKLFTYNNAFTMHSWFDHSSPQNPLNSFYLIYAVFNWVLPI